VDTGHPLDHNADVGASYNIVRDAAGGIHHVGGRLADDSHRDMIEVVVLYVDVDVVPCEQSVGDRFHIGTRPGEPVARDGGAVEVVVIGGFYFISCLEHVTVQVG